MVLFPKCLHTATPGNNLYLKHKNAHTSAKPVFLFSLLNIAYTLSAHQENQKLGSKSTAFQAQTAQYQFGNI
jgi:hypothetical protein